MLPALKVGGVYRARVEALMADGRVRLSLDGMRVDARCEAGLAEGTLVEVEVDRLWPDVVLRVRRAAPAAAR
ncbi:MAG TPA: hypothetical protein PKG80_04690 [Acidobacteriota bacterium]|nr:hypothetical protein [bacterium]HNX19549.1 hypothetical protein [Acidobacteriota bacterium]